jgi:formylglycine-generating enzyme required for sulfatase activity
VNIASRIEPQAKPGGICVSRQVYDLIRNKPFITATPLGEKELKGIANPLDLYSIECMLDTTGYKELRKELETSQGVAGEIRPKVRKTLMFALAAAALVIVGGSGLYFGTSIFRHGKGGNAQKVTQVLGQANSKESPPGFVLVKAGSFIMGSPISEAGRKEDEIQHRVTITRDYLIAKFDVTVGDFRDFVYATGYQTQAEKENGGVVLIDGEQVTKKDASWRKPYFQQSESDPVVLVGWKDAVAYCNWRSMKDGLDTPYEIKGTDVYPNWKANGYRLPTEAEWEYAARGGAQSVQVPLFYAGSNTPDPVAWYSENSGNTTHPVGLKAPNILGLYDMSGNVWQLCWDFYGSYGSAPQIDPLGASVKLLHSARGGSFLENAALVRIACRAYWYDWFVSESIGFRLARFP